MGRKLLFLLLLSSVIGIGVLHFTTPADLIFYHNTYRRLSYFPIVLGGLWFGLWGGIVLGLLSSIAFIPHLLLFAGQGLQSYYSELTEIALYLAAGALVGLIAGRERKLLAQIKKTSARLAQSYDDLYKGANQLIEAEEQLAAAQKMSILGEMSTTLAHEIRNPLSSIKGTAEILLDDFPEQHPKREFLEILLKETKRLDTTLKNVLDFASDSSSTQEPRESLSHVIQRQTKLIDPLLQKRSVVLEIEGEEDGMECKVVGGPMSQVFLNILINGIEALENIKNPHLKIEITGMDGGCLVEVHDNGKGIEVDCKSKVFEPFYSTRENGTGLGLLISRKIVESFGGRIEVKDSPLGGACFSVYLPELVRTGSLGQLTRISHK